jgi:ribosomal protein L32
VNGRNMRTGRLSESQTPRTRLIPEALKCKNCGKPELEHRAKTAECPAGPKKRVGYIQYGPTKFEAKEESV